MRYISFAWMTPALLARRKTCTRRVWSDQFRAQFHIGDQVRAFDRQPRFGGKAVALVRLIREPYLEHIGDMPDSDYEAEGFAYLNEHLEKVNIKRYGTFTRAAFDHWRKRGGYYYVVRFELVKAL